MRIVFSSCHRTIWTNKPVYPDPQDISYIVDGCYAAGHYPPNYPVPAIPIVADITEYYVILWEHTKTDTLECYGNVWEYSK